METVSFLLAEGAHVNQCNALGETPLHWACKDATVAMVEALLIAGASVHEDDGDGNSPLHWAAEHDRDDLIRVLTSYGASLQSENDLGQTPLEAARHHESFKAIKALNGPNQKRSSLRRAKLALLALFHNFPTKGVSSTPPPVTHYEWSDVPFQEEL